jgi:ArsR family transcriptional regulator, virulence genes transcriptional regulator
MKIDKQKMQKNAGKAASLLKSLASMPRLMVLCQLAEGEHTAGELWNKSSLSQSALSQHLAKLRNDKLVKTRKESQTVYYTLANKDVIEIIKTLHKIYCE